MVRTGHSANEGPGQGRGVGCVRRRGAVLVLLAAVSAAAPAAAAPPSFARDIKPLLSNKCLRCHGPDDAARQGGGDGGLRLDTAAGAAADLGGHAAIVPGDPAASVLLARVTSTDPAAVMPPPEAGDPLTPAQAAALAARLSAGGTIVLSGLRDADLAAVVERYRGLGLAPTTATASEGWHCLAFTAPDAAA